MDTPQHVLVAEDDPVVAETLSLALRAMGHDVTVASDGQAAIDRAREKTPALVLLDALLPRLDGFQVLRELRTIAPGTPVLMMSGIYTKRGYRQEALDLGAREYLPKPISVLRLWELVERHLESSAPSSSSVVGTPLAEKPLPLVLAELRGRAATGLLFVRGPAVAVLFIEDGRLVFARSNDESTRLDRILDATGLLRPEDAARARRLATEPNESGRFGEKLVADGLLTEDALRAALAEQQKRHLATPFTWAEGGSQFFESDAPRSERFKLEVDMEALLVWACRHVPSGPTLERWLPEASARPVVRGTIGPEEAQRLGLSPEELELVRLADGSRSAAALRTAGRLAQVDADHVLAGLRAAGRLDVQAGEVGAPPPVLAGLLVTPDSGDLESVAPAGVLIAAACGARSGVLLFSRDGTGGPEERTVVLERGRVAFARSNDPHDRLGQVLVRGGFLPGEALTAALEEARATPGRGLGRILVDRGVLGLDDLHRALVAQVREVVARVLGWDAGTYALTEGPADGSDLVPLGLDCLGIVLEALRTGPISGIAARLPDQTARVRKTERCFDIAGEIALSEMEDGLLLEVDRHPDVRSLIAASAEPPESVLRALAVLLSLDVLEVAAEDAVEPAGIEADRSDESPMQADAPPLVDPRPETVPQFEPLEPPVSPASLLDEDESFGEALSSEPSDESRGADGGGGDESFAGLDESSATGGSADDASFGDLGGELGHDTSFAGLGDDDASDGCTGEATFGDLGGELGHDAGFGGTAPVESSVGASADVGVERGGEGPTPDAPVPLALPGVLEDESFGQDQTTIDLEGPLEGLAVDQGAAALPTPAIETATELPDDFLAALESGDGAALDAALTRLAENDDAAPAAARAASTATAVLEQPHLEHLLGAQGGFEIDATEAFFRALAQHLAASPASVPDGVLATLPASVRERFGL